MTVVAISGASGLVGTELTQQLQSAGHQVVPISRRQSAGQGRSILWKPEMGLAEAKQLEGVDAVVHLAGENIAAGRWNEGLKRRIRESRVVGTKKLVESLVGSPTPPKIFVCASAIGFYGDRGDEVLTEATSAGSGFLPDVCREWEDAAMSAAQSGMRVVCVRIGVVLSPKGGALKKMLLPFKLGLGGNIGNGRQYWSWIGLHDLARVIVFCLEHDHLHGAVNAVSPEPLTNAAFTKGVGKALHRPTLFPMPAFAAKLVLGEMAEALLLSSARVMPEKLTGSGFKFEHPELVQCLQFELGRG